MLVVVFLVMFLFGAVVGATETAAPAHEKSAAGFLYWLLDSFMWAVALYFILTRRADIVRFYLRLTVRMNGID